MSDEKSSPFGPYRPKRQESPFGPLPKYRAPRDPFAPPSAEPERPAARPQRPPALTRPLALLVEVAPGGAACGHVPSLPGLCFRAGDREQLTRIAPGKVVEYLRWLAAEQLSDLTPAVREASALVRAGFGSEIELATREDVAGAPLWLSGEPAALFQSDRYALTDEEVAAHFRFAHQVTRRMRLLVAGLFPAQRAWKPAPDRRSIAETLAHLADGAWWYCARLDDALPEPILDPELAPLDQLDQRLQAVAEWLTAVPLDRRLEVHVPKRHPSRDPAEPWTHRKVCRREAEHLWEHLQGLPRAVQMAADA
jgi:hypothetical protein